MSTIIYSNGTQQVTVPSGEKIAIFSNSSLKLSKIVGYPNLPNTLDLETETAAGETYTSGATSADTEYVVEASAADAFYEVGASPSVSEPQPDITAADATFTITGLSAAQGGSVSNIGGTSSTSANDGGATDMTGGQPGATGDGGVSSVVGGIGGATSGDGGNAEVTGGDSTTSGNGGSVILTPGALGGAGHTGQIVNRGVVAKIQVTPTAETTAATLTIAELLTQIITGTHAAGATQAYTLPTGTLVDAAVDFSDNDSFDWCLINLSAAAADTVTVTAGATHTIVGNPIVQSAHVSTGGITGNSSLWRTRKTAANTYVTYRIS